VRAAVLTDIDQPLAIQEVEPPQVGPGDVLVRVKACGVCRTDHKVMEGRIATPLPAVIGHEVSGTIESVGAAVGGLGLNPGDGVIVGTRYRCGRCEYCLAGRENLCRARPVASGVRRPDGTSVNRWNIGGFADYVAVPAYTVFRVPPNLPLEEASFVGCRVTTAYNAVKNSAAIAPGDSALVVGCGGVGLAAIQFLRLFGAYPIVAADIVAEKLDAAMRFGASHTVNASEADLVEAVRDLTRGGVTKSFEALGNSKTADQIIQATRPGGRATIIGGLRSGPFVISDGTFAMREISVGGVALRRPTDVIEVLEIIRAGRLEISALVTARYRPEQINEAFEDLEAGRNLVGLTVWS
jgi:S-(hydroxymethyl)glutathione dehydrogenase/alcohol dehydrogenase